MTTAKAYPITLRPWILVVFFAWGVFLGFVTYIVKSKNKSITNTTTITQAKPDPANINETTSTAGVMAPAIPERITANQQQTEVPMPNPPPQPDRANITGGTIPKITAAPPLPMTPPLMMNWGLTGRTVPLPPLPNPNQQITETGVNLVPVAPTIRPSTQSGSKEPDINEFWQ